MTIASALIISVLLFGLPLFLPLRKLPLTFHAFIESENVRQDTMGDDLNLVLGNISVVGKFLLSAQILSSVCELRRRVLCALL